MRFDKKPKIVKKLQDGDELVTKPGKTAAAKKTATSNNSSNNSNNSSTRKPEDGSSKDKLPTIVNGPESQQSDLGLGVSGVAMNGSSASKKNNPTGEDSSLKLEERILKAPPQFGGDAEMKQLVKLTKLVYTLLYIISKIIFLACDYQFLVPNIHLIVTSRIISINTTFRPP